MHVEPNPIVPTNIEPSTS